MKQTIMLIILSFSTFVLNAQLNDPTATNPTSAPCNDITMVEVIFGDCPGLDAELTVDPYGPNSGGIPNATLSVETTGGVAKGTFSLDVPPGNVGNLSFGFVVDAVTNGGSCNAAQWDPADYTTFTLTCPPLDVNLISIAVESQEEIHELSWEGIETSFSRYEVERSFDAFKENLVSIDTVSGGKEDGRYSYSRSYISNGRYDLSYYRLKMIDTIGTFNFSPVVVAKNHRTPSLDNIIIYPNPVNNLLQIDYAGMQESIKSVELINILGQTVRRTLTPVHQLVVSGLAKGRYVLRFTNEIESITESIIIE